MAIGKREAGEERLAGRLDALCDEWRALVTASRRVLGSLTEGRAMNVQWLIERGHPEGEPNAVWLEHSAFHPAKERRWTTNAREAAMFPTRETAQAYIIEEGIAARAVEHGFMASPSAAGPVLPGDEAATRGEAMNTQPDMHVCTDERTNDQQLVLEYTMRPDPPHNPLRYDFRWTTPEGELRAGPFVTYSEAGLWRQGYDYATRAG